MKVLSKKLLHQIHREFVINYSDKLDFSTFDLTKGVPDYFIKDVEATYNYCYKRNISRPLILRPGSGIGKDMYIKDYMLNELGIKPSYYLIDKDVKAGEKLKFLNQNATQTFINHDLFISLFDNRILASLKAKIDIIDCRQVLHEIYSKLCGGSPKRHKQLLEQLNELLKKDGLMLIYDSNLVSNKPYQKITFWVSDKYQKYLEKFIQILNIGGKYTQIDRHVWQSSIRWFTIFYYKVDSFRLDMSYDLREMSEIHRCLTRADWQRLLIECGFCFDLIETLPSKKLENSIGDDIIIQITKNKFGFCNSYSSS
jgi:hypothetical protein